MARTTPSRRSSAAIKLARAGLRDIEKPIGSYLFSGPTGVGKTEVANQLAKALGVEMVRFDMSEYMERHTVSRLIGAPPGYVGFEQGGLLTDAVDQHPHSVLLLDEIEKAHPDLYNILLQVMDHGKLTDHNGKQISFRNVILVMTTNAGAADMAQGEPSASPRTSASGEDVEAINRMFAPEFRNRLDAIVPFSHLPTEVIAKVVDKFIMQLDAQLADRNVAIELSDQARSWLIEHGYDENMGARPMARVIQTHIKTPLADEVLFGRLKTRRHGAGGGGRRGRGGQTLLRLPRRPGAAAPGQGNRRGPPQKGARRAGSAGQGQEAQGKRAAGLSRQVMTFLAPPMISAALFCVRQVPIRPSAPSPRKGREGGAIFHLSSSSAITSASASAAVRPGDSMPKQFTSPAIP